MIRAALLLLLTLAGTARGDNEKLVKARAAIEAVRYDDARRLLVEALTRGASRPDELREIYELSAKTAVVLGQAELAEQYYRRMLALDPSATAPADASPKLREPFIAAQAYMAAQGRLDLRATRRGGAIEVTITDPLGMVVAVAVIADGVRSPGIAFAGEPIEIERATVDEIVALDEHGNYLRAIAGDSLGPPPVDRIAAPAGPRRPIAKRWQTWAIAASVATGAGVGFLVSARLAKARLDDILADDSMHFFAEAEIERERWRTHTMVSSVGFMVGGAFAVTAIAMAVTARGATPPVAATLGPDRAGLAIHGKF